LSTKVIVALDFPDFHATTKFLSKMDPSLEWVKVGMELFYSEGPIILKELKELNLKIFLDLKIHDIPNTAKGALQSVLQHKVDMVNLHVAGGLQMLKAAREVATNASHQPLLIGVTQLTSTDQRTLNDELGIPGSIENSVLHYARLAKEAGLHGVVCSAQEATRVHAACGEKFLTVCPGIRMHDEAIQDQVRVVNPVNAQKMGADFIVMGRSITQAKDPAMRYREILHLL
jgi:orotidine-5'-phosphate decarboxylase